jgi:hypothetical protein
MKKAGLTMHLTFFVDIFEHVLRMKSRRFLCGPCMPATAAARRAPWHHFKKESAGYNPSILLHNHYEKDKILGKIFQKCMQGTTKKAASSRLNVLVVR